MKNWSLIALSLVATACVSPGEPVLDKSAEFIERALADEDLVAEMGAITARDVYIRENIIEEMKTAGFDADARERFIEETSFIFTNIDDENTDRLKTLLVEYEWRDLFKASPRLAERMLSVVNHAGHDTLFQIETLAELEGLVAEGYVEGGYYARLYDKISTASGRPQRYGTQFKCLDGKFQPMEMESPTQVDERRAEMSLNTLAEYTAQQVRYYGECPAE